ncbi:MAG: phage portal protein, partial [Mariprofundaceae bacterium]|nr:phage portal protein [Mariprofundaceae bacterium]
MNILDKSIAYLSPTKGAARAKARQQIKAYEAGVSSTSTHPFKRDKGSADTVVAVSGYNLRIKARDLDRNHDIVHGALDVLTQNIVGLGIRPEPQVKLVSGELADEVNEQLVELWKEWIKDPEVTGERDYYSSQRLKCRTWLRDGEVLQQYLSGNVPFLKHSGRVPYSIEMLEADYLPLHLSDLSRGIIQGVQKNAWGQATAYHLYKHHPGDIMNSNVLMTSAMKIVPADRIQHLKLVDRIGQTRGVTCLASVINRLNDVKDYEDYERVAAKVAASMTGYIKKGSPDLYDGAGTTAREMDFVPGMIFDNLRPGEEIGTIDPNRPNTNLTSFRDGQLRAAASGMGVSFSSMSKNYEGSYSSRRQENVEQYGTYGVLWHYFSERSERPNWERFALMAMAAGLIDAPTDLDMNSLDDVSFSRPTMPVIDPAKDANANKTNLEMQVTSKSEIIRGNG